ncbi:MAG: trypsin-like peptidase domain-containing protein [Candidatus Binatia bacterium]
MPNSYLIVGLLFTCTAACTQGGAESTARRASGSTQARGAPSLPDFVLLAKDLQPAVVNVSAILPTNDGGAQGALPQDPDDEMTGKLFGMPSPDGPSTERSQGSGFIIAANGVILTNAHVIEGAQKITVRLVDKREFEANIVGKDPHTDIALIKIAAKENLPTLRLGDSDALQVGEWVMAVGNPFGLDSSVSSGIVSAKGRHLGAAYDRLIQTDASLNPGSSGGPLIDLDGQVVGISKAIVSQGGGNLGISFATPINLIKEILPQLQSSGKVTRGWAGLAIQEITPALAETLGLEKAGGALVAGIVQGGPAERGGIKIGDVITELDGKKVTDALELPLWIARMPIDKRVPIMVRREQQEVKLNLTVAALPEGPVRTPSGRIG